MSKLDFEIDKKIGDDRPMELKRLLRTGKIEEVIKLYGDMTLGQLKSLLDEGVGLNG